MGFNDVPWIDFYGVPRGSTVFPWKSSTLFHKLYVFSWHTMNFSTVNEDSSIVKKDTLANSRTGEGFL